MKNILRLFLILMTALFSGNIAMSQISEGGTPMGFSLDMQKEKIPVLTMPTVNVKTLLEEDEKQRKDDTERPFRFYGLLSVPAEAAISTKYMFCWMNLVVFSKYLNM